MAVVVDASALVAILTAEPEASAIAERLAGQALVGPPMLPYEVANAAVQKVRRKVISRDDASRIVADFDALDVQIALADAAGSVDLALETGLTAYDAGYLWLARELNADLVTLDVPLDKAWRRMRDDG